MVKIQVSHKAFVVFASIFKAGHDARYLFSYHNYLKAMKEAGFQPDNSGHLVPQDVVGTAPFVFPGAGRQVHSTTKVSKEARDQWKRELAHLYGWDASTFLMAN